MLACACLRSRQTLASPILAAPSACPPRGRRTRAPQGTFIVLFSFFSDMFSGPKPPPRSFYEATLWRGRRQVKVVFMVLLLALFVGWGILLTYFAFTDDGCASESLEALYNVAYLLVLLFIVIFGLVAILGCCVMLDCFVSGRVRLVMLLAQPEPSLPPPPEQYARADAEGDERLVPGVPPRDLSQYGSRGNTAGSAFLIGGVSEPQSRLCTASEQPTASWSAPGAKLPKVR